MAGMEPLTARQGGHHYIMDRVPANPAQKMLLLTVGGVAVIGQWSGRLGEYYQGWAPLPTRSPAR